MQKKTKLYIGLGLLVVGGVTLGAFLTADTGDLQGRFKPTQMFGSPVSTSETDSEDEEEESFEYEEEEEAEASDEGSSEDGSSDEESSEDEEYSYVDEDEFGGLTEFDGEIETDTSVEATASLTIGLSSSSAASSMVMAGDTEVNIGSYTIESDGEAVEVGELVLEIDRSASTSAIYALYVEYSDEDGSTVLEECHQALSLTEYECDLDIYVPEEGSTTVDLIADINEVSLGSYSGQEFYFTFSDDDFEAYGMDTGGEIEEFSDSGSLETNPMMVVNTTIETELDSASRSGTVSSGESVMSFDLTAGDSEDVKIRHNEGDDMGSIYGWEARGHIVSSPTRTFPPTSTGLSTERPSIDSGSEAISGSSVMFHFDTNEADDYVFTQLGDFSDHADLSFWIYSDSRIDSGRFQVVLGTDGNLRDGSSDEVSYDIPAFGDDEWTHVEMNVAPTSGSSYVGIKITDGSKDDLEITVDELVFYTDKVSAELTLSESWADDTPRAAYLQQEGTTVALGVVDLDSRDGTVDFIPYGTYAEIEVSAGSTDSFEVILDTASMIDDGSSTTETLTVEISAGGYDGLGDIYWYDGDNGYQWYGGDNTGSMTTVSSY